MATLLHLDTFNGTYTTTPYDCSWQLSTPIFECTSIGLVSVELGNVFKSIRASNLTNTITIYNGTTPYKVTLTAAVYTSITQLMTDLTTAYKTLNPALGVVFTAPSSGNINVTATSFVPTIGYADSNLPYVLGFLPAGDKISGNTLTAGSAYNLAYDQIIYMLISQPSCENNNNAFPASFKVLMSVSSMSIQYSSATVSINQAVRYNDPKRPISTVRIQLIDRFGYSFSSESGIDYSLSLSFNRG